MKERNTILPQMQAELFEEDGASLGSYVTDGDDKLLIGSSRRADLVVPHEAVSHIHAMLRVVGANDILLYDLGSEGGTFVGGERIIERRLPPGSTFEIGGHRVKVSLVQQKDRMSDERAIFWNGLQAPDFLEVICLEEDMVVEERSLFRNGQLTVGRRRQELALPGLKLGERFVQRQDTSSSHLVEVRLPTGYLGEVYDKNNQRLRSIESGVAKFGAEEKLRLVAALGHSEILLCWRGRGQRGARTGRDEGQKDLRKSLAVCAGLALIGSAFFAYVPMKKEVIEEATVPKTSYLRLSTDSAPAPAAEATAAPAAQPTAGESAPSKAAHISQSLSKLLNRKSALSAESIEQAVSRNGQASTRANSLKQGSLKSEAIAAGALGGGTQAMNALSSGLSQGAGGKAGSLKGFAGGKGTTLGGSGFGGKGFDMSLGGEEEEALGGLDKSLIAAVVQANIGQIKHCYERQLIVDPNIFGKVVAQWTIGGDGRVNTSSVKKSTMGNRPVENCILAKIKGWEFPKPKGGGQVIVSYPFLFKSLN